MTPHAYIKCWHILQTGFELQVAIAMLYNGTSSDVAQVVWADCWPNCTAHAQKLLYASFRLKFWHRHYFQRPDLIKKAIIWRSDDDIKCVFTVQIKSLPCFYFRSIWKISHSWYFQCDVNTIELC